MAIKKYHRNIDRPDYVSRSRIKLEANAIKDLAVELIALADAKLEKLPIFETSLKSLKDYKKMTTNLAKKRHLMFVAKCLRKEDYEVIRERLDDLNFSPMDAAQVDTNEQRQTQLVLLVEQLLAGNDSLMENLIAANPSMERQQLRQLVRNINMAKNDKKKQIGQVKLTNYLGDRLE